MAKSKSKAAKATEAGAAAKATEAGAAAKATEAGAATEAEIVAEMAEIAAEDAMDFLAQKAKIEAIAEEIDGRVGRDFTNLLHRLEREEEFDLIEPEEEGQPYRFGVGELTAIGQTPQLAVANWAKAARRALLRAAKVQIAQPVEPAA